MAANVLRRPLKTRNENTSEERSRKRRKTCSSTVEVVPRTLTFQIVGRHHSVTLVETQSLADLIEILSMEGHVQGSHRWKVMDMFTEEVFKYNTSSAWGVSVGSLEAATRIGGDLRVEHGAEILTLRLVTFVDRYTTVPTTRLRDTSFMLSRSRRAIEVPE